jgi:adenylate cyclase
MARDQRRLAAIVSADVAGYSRLMGVDDSGTLNALKAHRRELIDPKIAEYGGRIVKTTGDGLLLEFASVVDAVRCSVDVQRGMAERNADVPANQKLEFRIGVNVGDIIIDGDDIFGDGVNVAARLQALAEPGSICVSKVVRDQVMDKLSFAFDDLGAQQVKNIARPVEVYRVELDGDGLGASTRKRAGWRRDLRSPPWPWIAAVSLVAAGVAAWLLLPRWIAPAPSPPAMSVAIVPFTAPQGDADASRLADTLTRDLVSRLGRLGGVGGRLDVVAAGGAVTAGSNADVRDAARRLNVRYLLEGNAQHTGGANAVNLRILDTSSGAQIWSDRETLQDAVVASESSRWLQNLSRRVRTAVFGAESRRVGSLPVSALGPPELVLRAWVVAGKDGSLSGMLEARKLADEALKLDPNLVAALLTRASLTDSLGGLDPHADHARIGRQITDDTQRAVSLDSSDPWAWAWRAVGLMYLAQWDAALEANAMAAKLDPDESRFEDYRAAIMNFIGRPDEALKLATHAAESNPLDSAGAKSRVCQAYVLLGDTDNAVKSCEISRASNDGWPDLLALIAAYSNHGDAAKAAAVKAELLRLAPGFTVQQARAYDEPLHPEYAKLAEKYLYGGLRKAGLPEK